MKEIDVKKILFLALGLLCVCGNAVAGINVIKRATTISDAPVSATALTTGSSPYYTDAINVQYFDGYMSLLMVLADTPDIDVEIEASVDGTNFYTPYDTDGNALWSVSSVTSSRHQQAKLPLANYVRFKITVNANSTVSLDFVTREIR